MREEPIVAKYSVYIDSALKMRKSLWSNSCSVFIIKVGSGISALYMYLPPISTYVRGCIYATMATEAPGETRLDPRRPRPNAVSRPFQLGPTEDIFGTDSPQGRRQEAPFPAWQDARREADHRWRELEREPGPYGQDARRDHANYWQDSKGKRNSDTRTPAANLSIVGRRHAGRKTFS
jgi:hypothetical protein